MRAERRETPRIDIARVARSIRVRHGKGNRRRTVELTPATTTAVRRWDEHPRELGPPAGQQDLAPAEWPLFVTVGRRRCDGSYTRLGERPTRKVVDLLLKQLGARADIAEDLRHDPRDRDGDGIACES